MRSTCYIPKPAPVILWVGLVTCHGAEISIPNPRTMLLRDDSVQHHLSLSSVQQQSLNGLLDSIDYPLWRYRDQEPAACAIATQQLWERLYVGLKGILNVNQLQAKLQQHQVTYPVAQDSDSVNWDAWANPVWPAIYLVDKAGFIRYWWYGELNFQNRQGEQWIQTQLSELLADTP